MINYRFGDVILIPFPFTDLTAVKQRPAVILSSSRFNRAHQDVVIAAITSHIAERFAQDDYPLSPRELQAAGLPKHSLVKVSKIVTLDQQLIRKRLGSIPPSGRKQIMKIFYSVFQES